MRVRLNTGLMVIAFVVLSSWPALTVLSPSAPGSTATPGNFGLLKPREDKFLNYDVGCENDACRPSDCGEEGAPGDQMLTGRWTSCSGTTQARTSSTMATSVLVSTSRLVGARSTSNSTTVATKGGNGTSITG